MGIQQANIAHWCGANVIVVDFLDERLEVAKELGADAVINPSKDAISDLSLDYSLIIGSLRARLYMDPVIKLRSYRYPYVFLTPFC